VARKRMVDPAMFTSENVAALPVSTRWTWVGLLCYLDDFGRGRDNPALVKAAVWPLDDSYTAKKCAADLDRLVEAGMLCRYECCGSRQIHAPTWANWQKISHPTATKFCVCAGHEPRAYRIHRSEVGTAPEGFANDSGAAPRSVVSKGEKSLGEPGQPDGGPCPHDYSSPRLCALCRRGIQAVTA
jgi:hypothetical protein